MTAAAHVQRAFITWTDFNQQNIKVTAQLNVFGPGAYIAEDDNAISGDLGFAAVGVKCVRVHRRATAKLAARRQFVFRSARDDP